MKKLALLTLTLIVVPLVFATAVLPAIIGMFMRPVMLQALEQLQSVPSLNVQISATRNGWFSSDIHFSVESTIFSADGLSSVEQQGILYVNHGPFMWHLFDTRLAVAELRLQPAPGAVAANFSGSGLLQLTAQGDLQFDAIAGFTAFAGEHWLEIDARWPAAASGQGWRTVVQTLDASVNIDADAQALLASPAAEALQVYQRQGWTHLNSGRARSIVSVQNEILNINGLVMPVGLFLGSPEML